MKVRELLLGAVILKSLDRNLCYSERGWRWPTQRPKQCSMGDRWLYVGRGLRLAWLPCFYEKEGSASCLEVCGTEKYMVTPGPSLGWDHRRPPWLSMMDRQTERPIPIPSFFVV